MRTTWWSSCVACGGAYDHDAWYFGNGVIPSWAGYAIGHRLVVDYQASHPGDSAAELVNTPAEAFRPDRILRGT